MKKILLSIAVLFLSASMTFAARNGGMDLVDIFGKNQLGAGYDGREWDTSLYSDFGTDKLRFSVNLWKIGGSWFNNGETKKDGSTVPFLNGLPTFFVAAGYKFNDSFRLAVGYGGSLVKSNHKPTAYNSDGDKRSESGYYGNDVSVFFQANAGANIIRFATPIQFGTAFGATERDYFDENYTGTGPGAPGAYDMKNVSAFSMAPQIRWIGQAGPLVQVRFTVPFGMATAKSQTIDGDSTKEVKRTSIGAELRVYLQFATDPVKVQFVPRVIYNQAIEGNNLAVSGLIGEYHTDDDPVALPFIKGNHYSTEKPWSVRVDLPIDIGASSDIISVWGAPQVRFYAAGSPKTRILDDNGDETGKIRHDNFYGIAYALPLELVVRPIANLEFNIGMEVEATTPLNGGAANANASVDGSIIWYF